MSTPGRQVGPYVILGQLGAGGMGEVHLAHDPRLEREVALKMLPAAFVTNTERMERFRREALALAAINHPNIATIYGFEESEDGVLALVLERVEGESLAQRLRRGALPPTEALSVCAQIAEALEAAHARGVIHRDLKPGNVMLGPRGLVKVLDFGLAKSATSRVAPLHASGAETLAASGAGGSASAYSYSDSAPTAFAGEDSSGTPGYMSPEQVRGEPQDERTDVFAFGCVLYECLSGHRAFSGETKLAAMAAVLQLTPDAELLPRQTPPRVRDLLTRCLAKDPEQRLRTMHAARIEIEDALGIRRASALRTGDVVATAPNNLPRQPTRFVGREKAIEDCLGLLGSTRLLTLTGVGGCGKTRLALRLAERVLEQFTDGVWFVDLASLSDPERVPQAAATAMGVHEEPGSALIETLARHLAEQRALIVLDNCEHVLPACVALAEALLNAAPELRLLATSREGLGVRWEQTYPVASLSVPGANAMGDVGAMDAFESVRLFVDRAMLVQPGFALSEQNAPVVGEICRRLDGIPLAIELAAARVRVLSVEQIHAKLHDRFRLLAGGSKAALPRHQTLHAAIQWSYDHLTPDEQRLLRSLSVFAGGWTLEAATAACGEGQDEFEVLDLLTHLVDKSLVVVDRLAGGEPRYRFLETVRQFGRDLLIASGEGDASRRRHRDWFLALAESVVPHLTGPDQASWLDRLEAENENLRAALDWCLEGDPETEPALRMTGALNWFWVIRGYTTEGRGRLAAVLALPRPAEPTQALARTLHGAGNLAIRQDDYVAARTYYEQALAVREQLGDRRGVAGSLGSLGNVSQYQGDYAGARSLFERSLAINREVGYRPWEATTLTCLGNVSRLLGDFAAAHSYLEQAVEVNREVGNRVGEASSLDALGVLTMQTGDIAAARAHFEQALAIEREVGIIHDQAVTLLNLAAVAQRQGDPTSSRSLCADALKFLRQVGARAQVAGCLDRFASLAALASQPERSARLWGAASALREVLGTSVDPVEREVHDREVAAVRAALGEAAFAAAWAAGRELSLEQAVEEALADPLARTAPRAGGAPAGSDDGSSGPRRSSGASGARG